VVLCLVETGVRQCFIHWTISEALLVLTQGFPDDGTPGVPKHAGRNLCVDCFWFPVHEELVRLVELDVKHGAYNVKILRACL